MKSRMERPISTSPNDLFQKLRDIGFEIAKEEGLNLKSIERRPKQGTVGTCSHDGHLKILIRTRGLLPHIIIEENGRTLAHELAHLKHFNHSKEFFEYAALLCKKVEERIGARVLPERFYV